LQEKSRWDSGASSLCDLHLQSEQASIELMEGEDVELLTVVATGGPPGASNNLVLSSISDFETSTGDPAELFNLIGVVSNVAQPVDILTKDGKETQRCSITIFDSSQRAIEIAFWGADIKCVPHNLILNESIIMLTNIRIREFKGTVSASFSYQSILYSQPRAVFAAHLSLWLAKNKLKLSYVNWNQMIIKRESGPGT
jgi:hypothetical protein